MEVEAEEGEEEEEEGQEEGEVDEEEKNKKFPCMPTFNVKLT